MQLSVQPRKERVLVCRRHISKKPKQVEEDLERLENLLDAAGDLELSKHDKIARGPSMAGKVQTK